MTDIYRRPLRNRFLFGVAAAVIAAAAVAGGRAAAQDEAPGPLERHMQRILTGDGQWRTPNPDYEPGESRPREYGLRFRLSEDKSHATGELTGRYDDGREVVYFSMIALYNPVTEKVITQQIGWNGAYHRGEIPVQAGDRQVIDMIEYSPNGAIKLGRHQMHFRSDDVHDGDSYVLDDNGAWTLRAQWTWRRYSAD